MISNPEPSPALVQSIENNLLLKQALSELRTIKGQQEVNHLVAVALRDHDTIGKVEILWATMNQINFMLKIIAGLLGLAFTIGGILTTTHVVWHVP